MYLGRRPVDLVCQHQMVEEGAWLENKTGILRVKHLAAGEIGRKQVGGKLDTGKAPFDGASERLDGAGFGQPGSPFD